MDTTTIQRINTLTKELMSKGIEENSDAAFQKARVIVLGKKQVNDEMEKEFVDELRFLGRRVNELDEKIRGIRDDIKCVVEEVVKLRSQKKEKIAEAGKEVVKEKPKKETREGQRELKEPAGDVSVENIFYCGKK